MGPRQRVEYQAYRAAAVIAHRLPEPGSVALARVAGFALSQLQRDKAAMVARHQRRVLGADATDAEVARGVRRTFDSYARYYAESFRLPHLSDAEVSRRVSVDGFEHLIRGREKGIGVILALPHLGSWEVAGRWAAMQGIPVTVVVEPLDPPELFEWFAALRRKFGFNIVPLGPDAGSAVLRALKDNHFVGLLCDRDVAGGGIEVDFFGERTTLPAGPATLSLRTGAPLLPAAVYDRGGGRHHGVIKPPLDTERHGKLREDVTRVTQDVAHALEDLIRMAPEQWHLLQPNWPSDSAS